LRKLDILLRMRYHVTWEPYLRRRMDRSLTAQEAVDRLGYNVKHLYRLLNSGKMKGQRVGHIWLIDPAEVGRIKALQGRGGRLPKSGPKQA
jgi:excisionase family DNA binding protein